MKQLDRRDRFFQESLKLIHQKGFKATTIRDIADQLDFDVANVYNYIDSKESLLVKFLFDISAAFHQGLDHIIESTYSPQDKIRAIVSLNIRLTSQRPYEVSLLVNEWRNLAPRYRSKFIKEKRAYENKVRCVIEQGIKSGEFINTNIEITTYSVLASVRWLFDWYTDQSKKMNPLDLEKQLTSFILNGIQC